MLLYLAPRFTWGFYIYPADLLGGFYLSTRGGINLKRAYTESFSISPELPQICYINPVRYEKYDVI